MGGNGVNKNSFYNSFKKKKIIQIYYDLCVKSFVRDVTVLKDKTEINVSCRVKYCFEKNERQ